MCLFLWVKITGANIDADGFSICLGDGQGEVINLCLGLHVVIDGANRAALLSTETVSATQQV